MKALPFVASLCLLLNNAVATGADAYGRLLTSPQQRAQLDARSGVEDNAGTNSGGVAASESTPPPALKLNGTLISNRGKREIWINGERQPGRSGTSTANASIVSPGAVRVQPAPSARAGIMKPGQVMDTATGEISEAWSRAATD